MATNRDRYDDAGTAAYYAGLSALQPTEALLFARHIAAGADVLDIGVGGGRTSRHLAATARRYLGIDYAPAMVAASRARCPDLAFLVADARDLSPVGSSSFDAAVFSFNGIDYLETAADRAACLAEVARVLRPGGVFVFSSHNARGLAVAPDLANAGLRDVGGRLLEALRLSAGVWRTMHRSAARRDREGYVWDPVHGGLATYASTPEMIAPQLLRAGLVPVEAVPGPSPRPGIAPLVRWYYHVCRKPGPA
jgi:SAM-dependent methyltransferase